MTARKTMLMPCLGMAAMTTLATAPGVLADHGALSGEQVHELMVGSTATGLSSRNGRRWFADYATDGTYVLRVSETGWKTDGTWRIEGDLWCTERPQRSERCRRIEHVAGTAYHAVDDRGETMKFEVAR